MVQTKKVEVRSAIIDGARTVFLERGYAAASMSEIARHAGVSPANIYVYFGSKLEILFAVYDPWLRARMTRLAREARAIEEDEARLRFILRTLWRDIPADDNGFANNLMQALAGFSPDEQYSRDLLIWCERVLSELVAQCLPPERRRLTEGGSLAHLMFMAFDGFAVNHALGGTNERIDHIVDLAVSMLMGR